MKRLPVRLFALAAMYSLLASMIAAAGAAVAHGNPQITVSPNPVAAGGKVTIEGLDFDQNEDISLVLEGVSGETVLGAGTVMTDDKGDFHLETDLPASAGAGSYRVRAQSSDATAFFDLKITADAGAVSAPASHRPSVGFHRVGSTSEIVALSAVLALLAIAGAGLLLSKERAS